MQDEHHGSLIVNAFTVSGKTAVWSRGKIIELVKSKDFLRLLSTNCYRLVMLITNAAKCPVMMLIAHTEIYSAPILTIGLPRLASPFQQRWESFIFHDLSF